jgi:hypothetical protein
VYRAGAIAVPVLSLSDAADRLGRSRGSLVWLLRVRRDIAESLPRVGGRRVFRPGDLELIAAAYAARTRKRPAPESQP